MNKKFLNAILFGALAFTTVTFTSCKDYDDDIDSLSGRVDAVEKSLSDLKADFGNIAYVKSVTYSNGVLTVTPSVGTPQTYNIPADTNTTYTLSYTTSGSSTTITLKDNSGKACGEVTITDTNTQNDPFDPSLLTIKNDKVVYGKAGEEKETGLAVNDLTPVIKVLEQSEENTILGWMIGGTKLNICDVLPITSVSFIPEVYYNGIEAVEFATYNFSAYNYTSKTTADTTYTKGAGTYYSEAAGLAKYHVNPASATNAQIAELSVLSKTAVNKSTKAVAKEDIVVDVKKDVTLADGQLAVAIKADMADAENGTDGKFDMFAIQMTTVAGNTFTTPYFAAIRADENGNFSLKNTAATPAEFNNAWATVKGQKAAINAENIADADNNALVVPIAYTPAKDGIDLNDYVKVYMGDKKIEASDLAAKNLKISYILCGNYVVNGTDQINYAKLSGSTLTAYNYQGQEKSFIGKTPIVKVVLNETTNKVKNVLTDKEEDAVVAVAYVKVLYVGDEVKAADPYYSETLAKTHAWNGCVTADDLKKATTVEYMSTKVYTLTGNKDNLDALSKETFTTIYKLDASYDLSKTPGIAENYSKECTVTEAAASDNADNKIVNFTFTDAQITALNAAMTAKVDPKFSFTFYAVYKKEASYNVPSSTYAAYPEIVAIPYEVTVTGYPTNGKSKADIKDYFIDQVFDVDGYAICKGTKFTKKGAVLALDLAEAIRLANFEKALYKNSTYSFELDEASAKIASFDNELCKEENNMGTGNWVILTEELKENATATVIVNVIENTCNNVRLDAGQVKIKFYSPASVSLTSETVTITDVNGNKTASLKNLLKIASAKDNKVLYEKGSVVADNAEAAKNILGETPNITVTKVADSSEPKEYENSFTVDNDGVVTWNLNGQNSVAEGKKVTCQFQVKVVYGNALLSEVITGCKETTQLKGCSYTKVITVEVINPLDEKK